MSGRPKLTAAQRKEMKNKICEILEKSPIIESACQKVGISRMTFYRWTKKDKKFAEKVEEILGVSREIVNDLAENKLIQLIDEGNMNAIRLWLGHNSYRYKKIFKDDLKIVQPVFFGVDRSPFMTGGVKRPNGPNQLK